MHCVGRAQKKRSGERGGGGGLAYKLKTIDCLYVIELEGGYK